MLGVSRIAAVGGLLAVAALVLLLSSGRAQDTQATGEKVKFKSVDGVDLHGIFYGASDKQKAPAVMIIHAIGDNSRSKEYAELAGKLQKEGFSVLAFDLRGHGQSTTVDPAEFWSPKYANWRAVAGATQKKDTIELRDIPKAYYSVFLNDIAAAKSYLDRKNDLNECNSSSLTVIGADSGATLGAIWINSEWNRYKLLPAANLYTQPQPDLKNPEGKNIICGFWLSITSDLGTRKISLNNELYEAAKVKKVPMVFVYNENDSNDKSSALGLKKFIRGKDKKSYPFTDAVAVQAAGSKLTGRGLLKQMGSSQIADYLKNVKNENGNEWQLQEPQKTQYMWKVGPRYTLAKQAGETTLRFSLYNEFIR
jgi:hypothetical protein